MDALAERLFPLYAALAVVVALLPTARPRLLGGVGLALTGLGASADAIGGSASGTAFAAINEILAGLGAAVVLTAVVLALRSATSGELAPEVRHGTAARRRLDPILLLGLLLASVGPHLIVVCVGVLLVLVSAARAALSERRPAWLIAVVAAAGLLGTAFFLLFTILGATGGRVSQIAGGPVSPPAERLLVVLLAGAALLIAGLPPLHRAPWALSVAPLGAILFARFSVPAFPEGLLEWQPLGSIVLVASLAAAAVTGRWAVVLVAGGILTLASGRPGGVFPGCTLVLAGWLADAARHRSSGSTDGRIGRWVGVSVLVPAIAAPLALQASLSAQVSLSVLAVIAVMIGFGIEFRRRSPARS